MQAAFGSTQPGSENDREASQPIQKRGAFIRLEHCTQSHLAAGQESSFNEHGEERWLEVIVLSSCFKGQRKKKVYTAFKICEQMLWKFVLIFEIAHLMHNLCEVTF